MAKFLYRNFASTTLAGNLDAGDTTFFDVQTGEGDAFPAPAPGDNEQFEVVIQNSDGAAEIIYCHSRTDDRFFISLRAQGDTTDQSWLAGDRVEMRPTAEAVGRALQRQDDSLTGALDANGNEIQNVEITGASMLVGTDIRATDRSSFNNILVPDADADPTIGGNAIWHEGNVSFTDPRFYFVPGMIMMWYSNNPPDGWAICDGGKPNGGPSVPDMRARFVLGYHRTNDQGNTGLSGRPDETETVGSKSGNYTRTTSTVSSHNHSGNTGNVELTIAQMPAHKHYIEYNIGDADNNQGTGDLARDQNVDGVTPTRLTGGGAGAVEGEAQPHRHTISSAGGHSHTLNNEDLTPYIVMAFIVKLNDQGQMPS